MGKRALIVWGGWAGHEPEGVSALFAGELKSRGFEVEVSAELEAFSDADKLKQLDLLVPCWTMGDLKGEQAKAILEAVESGVGIAGTHGGMGDAFRTHTEYQFMTGGQFVAHPGGGKVRYTVNITDTSHFITQGMKDFEVESEQYYMHVDPSNKVLATTRFPTAGGPHVPNGPVDIPQVWTRYYGKGRVAYSALGHNAEQSGLPEMKRLWIRCLLWASHAEELTDT